MLGFSVVQSSPCIEAENSGSVNSALELWLLLLEFSAKIVIVGKHILFFHQFCCVFRKIITENGKA
jgi:hypothetical protein